VPAVKLGEGIGTEGRIERRLRVVAVLVEGVRLERVEQRRELRLVLIHRRGLGLSGLTYNVV
jgi:hypothetical protein